MLDGAERCVERLDLEECVVMLAKTMTGGVLARWIADTGATSSAPVDSGAIYRRLRCGRTVPLGAVEVTRGGRVWYFREVESRADVAARGLLHGLILLG